MSICFLVTAGGVAARGGATCAATTAFWLRRCKQVVQFQRHAPLPFPEVLTLRPPATVLFAAASPRPRLVLALCLHYLSFAFLSPGLCGAGRPAPRGSPRLAIDRRAALCGVDWAEPSGQNTHTCLCLAAWQAAWRRGPRGRDGQNRTEHHLSYAPPALGDKGSHYITI